jgi:hypothetical protein
VLVELYSTKLVKGANAFVLCSLHGAWMSDVPVDRQHCVLAVCAVASSRPSCMPMLLMLLMVLMLSGVPPVVRL